MPDFVPGLEGVVAFETEIAEPDKDGGSLRYRGVDIEELVGLASFSDVWGLLVDNSFTPGLPPFNNLVLPVNSGDVRVDVQAGLATLAPQLGFKPTLDLDDTQIRDELAQTSVTALSYVAQSARGDQTPVPQAEVDKGATAVEQFLLRWRGEVDPLQAKALDAYWVSAAEHGLNASTFTARVVASTGADVAAALSAAIGAMSGPAERNQRRVLGGTDPRPGCGSCAHVRGDVHLRTGGGLERARARREAHRSPHPAIGSLHRPRHPARVVRPRLGCSPQPHLRNGAARQRCGPATMSTGSVAEPT